MRSSSFGVAELLVQRCLPASAGFRFAFVLVDSGSVSSFETVMALFGVRCPAASPPALRFPFFKGSTILLSINAILDMSATGITCIELRISW